jgi:hypothetical protein
MEVRDRDRQMARNDNERRYLSSVSLRRGGCLVEEVRDRERQKNEKTASIKCLSKFLSLSLALSLSLSLSLGIPWQSYVCISLSRSPSRHKYGFATSSLGLSRKSRACVAKRPNRRPKNPNRRWRRLQSLKKKKAPRKAPEERLSLHEIISVALVSSHGCVVCLPYGVKIVVARTQNPHDALKLFEFKTF